MRIILKKGKQEELINLAKANLTWRELSKELNLCSGYIRNELRNEEKSLQEITYKKLCGLSRVNFDGFVVKEVHNNWGQVKGGIVSRGNLKDFVEPAESRNLAELFGIILGDGHIDNIKIGKKIRCYCITISGDSIKDKDYLEEHIPNLLDKLFRERGHISYSKNSQSISLKIHGKNLVDFVMGKGLKSGNKKLNNQAIPKWILNNKGYLVSCIRGLVDTDGSIHHISKKQQES